jgi:hypothetical protein
LFCYYAHEWKWVIFRYQILSIIACILKNELEEEIFIIIFLWQPMDFI